MSSNPRFNNEDHDVPGTHTLAERHSVQLVEGRQEITLVPRVPPPREEDAVVMDEDITEERGAEARALLERLVRDHTLVGGARTDADLHILARVGHADFEETCTVAAMSARPFQEAARELGLGRLIGVCALDPENSWYVRPTADGGLFIGLGPLKRNVAEAASKFISATEGGK